MQAQGQGNKTNGVVLGVAGAVVVSSVGALSVAESWRVWDRCIHSPLPAGFTPLGEGPEDAIPTLFPIGYRCVWEGSNGHASVDFTNWPLTIAAIAGFALIALAGWRLSRSKD